MVTKRKNGAIRIRITGERLLWLILGIGLIALLCLTGLGLWLSKSGLNPSLLALSGRMLIDKPRPNSDDYDDMFIVNANGSGLTPLTDNLSLHYDAVWSPDGKQIAFVGLPNHSSSPKIYIMNVDSSNLHRLTASGERDGEASPSWSPDGQIIAYENYNDSSKADPYTIRTIRFDGTNPVSLTTGQFNCEHPVWSPDGQFIAFQSMLNGPELYVMRPNGSDAHRILDKRVNADFSWSPDSKRLAFTTIETSSSLSIYIVNLDGTNLVRLLPSTMNVSNPQWSLDGQKIAFEWNHDPQHFGIYMISVSGGDPIEVMPHNDQVRLMAWGQ